MIKKGAIQEVKRFAKLKVPNSKSPCRAIGINEIKEYLQKKINIDEVKDLIKFRTHQYAKRQITWLKHQMISWKSFSTQESDKIIDYFIKKL